MFKLEGISKTFSPGLPTQLTVLDNLNLEIEKGEFVILLGSNGAGKSTLLKIISGEVAPDSGRLFLGTAELTRMPAHERSEHVYLVHQSREKNLVSVLTVIEAFVLAMNRNSFYWRVVNKGRWERYVKDLLAPLKLGLENRVNDQVWSLSGGEHQIITILVAAEMIRNSGRYDNILLLDEHIAHLDPNSSNKVMELTAEMVKQYGLTTLMVTHNINLATRYGDRVLVLKGGEIKRDLKRKHGESCSQEELTALITQ